MNVEEVEDGSREAGAGIGEKAGGRRKLQTWACRAPLPCLAVANSDQ